MRPEDLIQRGPGQTAEPKKDNPLDGLGEFKLGTGLMQQIRMSDTTTYKIPTEADWTKLLSAVPVPESARYDIINVGFNSPPNVVYYDSVGREVSDPADATRITTETTISKEDADALREKHDPEAVSRRNRNRGKRGTLKTQETK